MDEKLIHYMPLETLEALDELKRYNKEELEQLFS